MTGILEQLKWEYLGKRGKARGKASMPIILEKGLKGAASISANYLVPTNRRTRIHNSLALQIPLAWSDIKESRDLNALSLRLRMQKTQYLASQGSDNSILT